MRLRQIFMGFTATLMTFWSCRVRAGLRPSNPKQLYAPVSPTVKQLYAPKEVRIDQACESRFSTIFLLFGSRNYCTKS